MDQVAPLTRHILLDELELVVIWIHALVVPFLVVLMLIQWNAPKGTRRHVRVGRWIGYLLMPIAVATGIVLLVHNLARPEQRALHG